MVEPDLLTPELNVERAVKAAMNRAAKASGLSREQIVDRMIEVADRHHIPLTTGNARRLNVETLNKWLNPNSDHCPLVRVLPVFCSVVRSLDPYSALIAPHGGMVIAGEDVVVYQWGRNEVALKRNKRLKQQLEAQLR